MGGYGIVGGNLPLAAGLALSSEYKGEDAVTVCMFGDGASNTGNFGETMNLAALWKLPVVFIVENNLYGMGTAVERHSAVTDLSKKAEGLGVPGTRVDGMDVLAVRARVAEHLRQARDERRPTLIEAFTYRFRGHSAADPEVYRTKEEVAEWQQKDPIEAFNARLVGEGVIGADELDAIRERAEQRVLAAVEFADASPEPPLDSLYDNLYVLGEQVPGWYAVDERTPEPHRGEAEREAAAAQRVRELAEAGAAYAGQPATAGRRAGDELADREGGEALEERVSDAIEARDYPDVPGGEAEETAGDDAGEDA
jgi:TPP-dependent pyruvate/acetoin dehydrogenase alpha subunit